jgi:hypothetical protein
MSSHDDQLARHLRRLGNHALNELLLQLPKPCFAALVEVALARPVLPAGLVLCFEPAPGVDGWAVVACAPRRQLGTLTRERDPDARVAWRAWTRAGHLVRVAGVGWWRRRGDAAAALAWVTPASGARCLALAAYVRALPDPALHQLLLALPTERFDRLLEAAYQPQGSRHDRHQAVSSLRAGQISRAVLPAPRPAAVAVLPILQPGRLPRGPEPPRAGPVRGRTAAGGGSGSPAPPPRPGSSER